MNLETIEIVIKLFILFFGFHTILFGWVFYRLNSNQKVIETNRIEHDKKAEMHRLELTEKIESVRLEYVDKVTKLHDEDRLITKTVHSIQIDHYKALTELSDKFILELKSLNVMSKPDVIKLVDDKFNPMIESNKELVNQVSVLIDRSK